MRFFYIAMTAAFAATTIAAPMPEEGLSVSGSGDLDISGKGNDDLNAGASDSISVSGKREAVPEKALTVGADGGLVINLKRDSVSAELEKLLRDVEKELKKLLLKRDAVPDEDLSVSGDGSVSVNGKREQAQAAAAVKDLVVNADGSIGLGLKRDAQSLSALIQKVIKDLEKLL